MHEHLINGLIPIDRLGRSLVPCVGCGRLLDREEILEHEPPCRFEAIDRAVNEAWERNNAAAKHSWG